MTFSIALLLLTAAISDSPTVAVAMATEAPTQVDAKPKKPKKICRAMDNVTGSRVTKQICKTQEQWDQGESAMEIGQKSGRGNLAPAKAMGQ